jgi:hypothetical protein
MHANALLFAFLPTALLYLKGSFGETESSGVWHGHAVVIKA